VPKAPEAYAPFNISSGVSKEMDEVRTRLKSEFAPWPAELTQKENLFPSANLARPITSRAQWFNSAPSHALQAT